MSALDDLFMFQQKIDRVINPIVQPMGNPMIVANNMLGESLINIPAISISHTCQESWTGINRIMQNFVGFDYFGIMDIYKSAQTIIQSVQPNINLVNDNIPMFLQNYDIMISGLENMGFNLSELVQKTCDEIGEEDCTEDKFSSKEEIVETLQEQAEDPKAFQKRTDGWSETKKKIYSYIIASIIFLWTNFLQPYFQDTIGKPVTAYVISKVKEFPETAGKVIDELKKDMQAIITEDVPYYYRVIYTDEEGNVKEGYVAKKNIKVIETEEAIEENAEDSE